MASVVRRAALAAGAGVDHVFVRTALRSRRPGRGVRAEETLRLVEEAGPFYSEAAADGRLFAAPDRPRLEERSLRPLPGGGVLDLSWSSGYAGLHERYRARLAGNPANTRAHVRWYRHRSSAPALVAVHGYGLGHFAFEERAFCAPWFYAHGFDVCLFTLPFHARRAASSLTLPPFPAPDPFLTNDGLAHAVHDLRALVALLRDAGAPAVGLAGMSLGGLTSALFATVEDGLDFAVLLVAVASLPDMMWRISAGTAARRRAERLGLTAERFAAAFAPTQPLTRAPLVSSERVLVVAAERDRVVPGEHARQLREHFGAGELTTFPGAHLLQLGRGAAFRTALRFVRELGVAGGGRADGGRDGG